MMEFNCGISQIENISTPKVNQLCPVHGIDLGRGKSAWKIDTIHMEKTIWDDMNAELICNLLVLVVPLDNVHQTS